MFESLRMWAVPYGGDAFLYLSFLAAVSLVALWLYKKRLSAFTLRRFIRLGALIALPLTLISMEMGDSSWPIAAVAIVWAVVVAITCHLEASKRPLVSRKDKGR